MYVNYFVNGEMCINFYPKRLKTQIKRSSSITDEWENDEHIRHHRHYPHHDHGAAFRDALFKPNEHIQEPLNDDEHIPHNRRYAHNDHNATFRDAIFKPSEQIQEPLNDDEHIPHHRHYAHNDHNATFCDFLSKQDPNEQQSLANQDAEPNDNGKDDYPDMVSSMETLNVSRSDSDSAAIDDIINSSKNQSKEVKFAESNESSDDGHAAKKATRYTKQHTGLKNISSNVGAAVMPSNKMEFDQEERESFGVCKINRPIGGAAPSIADNSDANSTVSSEGLTEQGYFDLKFYHNKLW